MGHGAIAVLMTGAYEKGRAMANSQIYCGTYRGAIPAADACGYVKGSFQHEAAILGAYNEADRLEEVWNA